MDFIRGMLIDEGVKNVNSIFNSVRNSFTTTGDLAQKTIEDLVGKGAFDSIINLSKNTIMPIAMVLLIVFLVVDLSSKLIEFDIHSDTTQIALLSMFVKLFLGGSIILATPQITNLIYDIPVNLAKSTTEVISVKEEELKEFDFDDYIYNYLEAKGEPLEKPDSLVNTILAIGKNIITGEVQTKEVEDISYRRIIYFDKFVEGGHIGFVIYTMIANLLLMALPIIVTVLIYARAIKLLLYIWASPLNISTIFSRSLSQGAINFLKNLFAISLQVVVMMMIIYIYYQLQLNQYLKVLDPQSTINLSDMSIGFITYGILGITMLFGSFQLAKELTGSY